MPNHINLPNGQNLIYNCVGRGSSPTPTHANLRSHIQSKQTELQNALNNADILATQDGKIFTFVTDTKFPFETLPQKFIVSDTKINQDGKYETPIFIPTKEIQTFINSINSVIKELSSDSNKYGIVAQRLDHIEQILASTIEQLCDNTIDTSDKIISKWYEVWFYRETNQKKDVWYENLRRTIQSINNNDILYTETPMTFPSRFVINMQISLNQLAILISSGMLVTAIKPIPVLNTEFTSMHISEQKEWSEDLTGRTELIENAPVVGLIDTGVLSSHILLEKYIASSLTYKNTWGTDDDVDNPHGTLMSGTILYDDLKEKLLSSDKIYIPCKISSYKLLHKNYNHKKDMYGMVTANAVSSIEIKHPNVAMFCMAITADTLSSITKTTNNKASIQTSWSSMIDKLSYGDGITEEETRKQRLFFISAGNIYPDTNYPDLQRISIIQDPSQAYNAITVGGYTNLTSDSALAQKGELSPFTSTGLLCDAFKDAGLKPDIVCEAGNTTNDNPPMTTDDLSILTTTNHTTELFTTYEGTSPATAQAIHIASHIQAKYPEYRPETIRALLIHSAEWTDELKHQFLPQKPNKTDYKYLVQTCGYGVPNIERAVNSDENRVCLIIEDQLQPFVKDGKNKPKYNEYKLHSIPLPNLDEFTEDLQSKSVRVKVTLSYFIEPLPEGLSTVYHSCGLNFILQNPTETPEEFNNRISKIEGNDDIDRITDSSDRWLIGVRNRSKGSVHSDIWETSLSDLVGCNHIAIIPSTGWWKTREKQRKYNNAIRYSLVISVDTSENLQLYTKIENKLKSTVKV